MEEHSQNQKRKNFRRRRASDNDDDDDILGSDEQERRMVLEEVKFLQKQRQRKSGIPAFPSSSDKDSPSSSSAANASGANDKNKKNSSANKPSSADHSTQESGPDKDDLVLQDTFAQETAVMVEDPNMLKYVEQELAKKRGRVVDDASDQVERELKKYDDELYKIPDHLKVKKRNSEESSTQWTTGIAEIQLPIEYKLKNIEETEAAKKVLQEKRLTGGRNKSDSSIPSSFSADYFQRGRDYAEKLRRDHPELYKDRSSHDEGAGSGGGGDGSKQHGTTSGDGAGRRQAATDQFMLERFRKRERARVMRR